MKTVFKDEIYKFFPKHSIVNKMQYTCVWNMHDVMYDNFYLLDVS